VRLSASDSYRAAHLAEIGDISLPLAFEQIHWTDAERRGFIETQFGADVDRLGQYDLAIDCERFTVSQIVHQVIHALKEKRTESMHRRTA
jgi:cytidylate kinase